MIELRASRHVGSDPDTVYDLITDIRRMGQWSPENEGGRWCDGATTPAVGARFTSRNRRRLTWTTTAVVTEADRGAVFSFTVGRPDRPDTRWRYTFSPKGEGCEVIESCQILREPGPIGRLLTRLGTGVPWSARPADLQHGMEETLRRLAAAAENHGAR